MRWPIFALVLFMVILVPAVRPGPTGGRIKGHLHYPACFPPDDLTVCAESIDERAVVCTRDLTFTAEGYAYSLWVHEGQWRVYAVTTLVPNYRAFYTKRVLCGLSVECTDRTPLVVDVRAGHVVSGVDPDDWFDHRAVPARPTPPDTPAVADQAPIS